MVIDYLVNVSLEIIRCYLSYLGGKKAGNRIPGNWAIWYEKFYFYSLSKIVPTKKKIGINFSSKRTNMRASMIANFLL